MKRLERVKSLQEEYGGLGYLKTRDLGIKPIEVDKITGSVGRAHDLDGSFRFRWKKPTDRYLNIKRMMEEGKALPPIEVYKIRDEYYVLDGHHRVAAAKELGQRFIDAHIIQAYPLKPKREDLLYSYRESFREKTGLDIELTEINGYEDLLSEIEDYAGRKGLTLEEAVNLWYRDFLSACQLIKREGLNRLFPDKTLGDIYIYISKHKWYKSEELGRDIGIKQAIKSFKELYSDREKPGIRFLRWLPVKI